MEFIKKFSNGFTLVGNTQENNKSISAGVFVDAGVYKENNENNGISHFIEHMTFKGTEKRNTFKISDDIDRIGGSINAFTGKESTCYFVKVIDEHIDEALEVLSDIFFNSKYEDSELDKERKVILEEIDMSNDSPDGLVLELLDAAYFKGNPLEKTILGPKENISRFNRNDILRYREENYCPNNVVLSIVGNISEGKAIELAEKYFVNSFKCENKDRFKQIAHISKPCFIKQIKDIEQANLAIALPGIKYDDPLTSALSLFSSAFGSGMSSRLFREVRENNGLAYSIEGFKASYINNGLYTIYAGVSNKNIEKTLELIKKVINDTKNLYLDDEEFYRILEREKSAFLFGIESNRNVMLAMGKYAISTGNLFNIEERFNMVKNTTKEQVQEISNIVLDTSRVSLSYVGSVDKDEKLLEILK